jgi:hypothetical protein
MPIVRPISITTTVRIAVAGSGASRPHTDTAPGIDVSTHRR